MEKEKVWKLLLEFSIPAIIGMMVNAIYNIVDRMFIGNAGDLGSLGLAAITITFPVTLALMAFSLMVGVGGSTQFSISLGAKRDGEAKYFQGNALMLTIIFGLAFSVVGLFFIEPLLKLLGASGQVLPHAKSYLSIVLYGAVFQCVAMCGNNFSRAQGNPRNAMISQMIGAGTNIILDYVFIIHMHMGMEGAALATIIGQFLSMVWQLAFLFGKKSMIPCRLEFMWLKMSYSLKILKTGIPAFLLQISASFLNIILNSILGIYGGDLALSTAGIVTSIQTLILMPLSGMIQGQQPIMSYSYGAKLYHRVKETLKYTVIISTCFVVICFVVIMCFSPYIIMMFNQEVEIVSLGKDALRLWFIALPLLGCQMMCSNFFQTIGRVKESSFLNLLRQFLLLIPLLYIMSSLFGLYGVFIAVPVADAIAFVITLFMLKREFKKWDTKEIEMNKKIIFLDVDGTLKTPKDKISQPVIEAIKQARRHGHLVYICTGRNRVSVNELCEHEWDGLICSAGGFIEIENKQVYENFMPLELLTKARDAFENANVLYNLEATENTYQCDTMKEHFEHHFLESDISNSEMERLREQQRKMFALKSLDEYDQNPVHVHKMSFVAENEDALNKVREVLKDDVIFVVHELFSKTTINGEIIMKGMDKGEAVKWVVSHLGLSMDDTICFGDSMNDYQMFEVCHTKVAMENASPALKDIATTVCESVENDGIYHEFKRLGLIEK